MISCETCGSDKFHFSETLGIVCEECVKQSNENNNQVIPDWYDGSSRMDLIAASEIYE